jgi:mannose-6-phosphate isomerase
VEAGEAAVGEIWFKRAEADAPEPALLLKLLYPSEALSIQDHPDNTFARSIGLAHVKTGAWYVLSATPKNAKVAVGLIWRSTLQQLRTSIEDGSIVAMVCWRQVRPRDVVFAPASTIHAVGARLVAAEIWQRSDATFRLLIACPYFILERIDLPPDSNRLLSVVSETWLFALDDHAQIGPTTLSTLSTGETALPEAGRVAIQSGPNGLSGRVAYLGAEPRQGFLNALTERTPMSSIHSMEMLS